MGNGGGTKAGDAITGLAVIGLFLVSVLGMRGGEEGLFASAGVLAAILSFVQVDKKVPETWPLSNALSGTFKACATSCSFGLAAGSACILTSEDSFNDQGADLTRPD